MAKAIVRKESILEAFGAEEVEFLANDVGVEVVPAFRTSAGVHLIAGSYGPFEPTTSLVVPLWMAKTLKKQKKVRISPPGWMEVASLRATYDAERADPLFFEELPYHYVEIASQLLDVAPDDIPEANTVRQLVEDIWEVRHLKIMAGMRSLDGESPAIKLNNLAAMEINAIRAFFIKTMDHYALLTEPELALSRSAPGRGRIPSSSPSNPPRSSSASASASSSLRLGSERSVRPRSSTSTSASRSTSRSTSRSVEHEHGVSPTRFPAAKPRPRSRGLPPSSSTERSPGAVPRSAVRPRSRPSTSSPASSSQDPGRPRKLRRLRRTDPSPHSTMTHRDQDQDQDEGQQQGQQGQRSDEDDQSVTRMME